MSDKKQSFKYHYGYTDCNDNRIEWFTNLGPKFYKREYLTLKTGKFRISRKDNARGHRYFINDLRDANTEPNAVVLFDKVSIAFVEKHEVKPAYVRDDVKVYYFGEYSHPNLKKKLIISIDGIQEMDIAV